MTVKRPDTVAVGPFVYMIQWDTPGIKEDRSGDTNNAKFLIRIQDDISEQAEKSVLWHEILHATSYVFGQHMQDAASLIALNSSLDVEELYVRIFEIGLLQVMRDNPEVMLWING